MSLKNSSQCYPHSSAQSDSISLKGNMWIYPKELDTNHLKQVAESYDLSNLESIFLMNRITNIHGFLNDKISDYLQDKNLVDMGLVVQRIKRAIQNKEKVAILGDYDVDGITSTALFIKLFDFCKIDYVYKIPNRSDGYGHNIDDINKIDASLILVLDCGSSQDFTDVESDVCIIDHHQTSENPNVLGFVNPYRLDINPLTQENFKGLCTAGLIFIVIFNLVKEMNLQFDFKALLDLVALGTIGDCMELTGINRAYVKYGLQLMNLKKRDGIKFLCENLKLGQITASQVAFYICPCINAAGRLGESNIALRFLCNDHESYELSRTLIALNSRRKEIEQACLQEILNSLDNMAAPEKCIIVENEQWHPGIVGILAGRLKEKFTLPTFVLYKKGEFWKGSARSVNGVNIGSLIHDSVCKEFAKEGGGHAMAGGVTIHQSHYGQWKNFIIENIKYGNTENTIKIDANMSLKAVCNISVDKIAPFGIGNNPPQVIVKKILLENAVKYNEHVRLNLNENGFRKSIFAFRWGDLYEKLPIGKFIDIIIKVDEGNKMNIIDLYAV
ncbi:single-stranded-DNA-specific exonuclease RecJ [Candidatus Cytomitobacter primus]|uniref:Single-stranded-DNA-specific exonuclease RecJ n=1 Tax=Candidatus Cytomitobacter primus TaxID=2066024 RepID=A0A5C0UE28_9PROT|nr:DHHA1 domain-containing protein [Candidatus Cytomitobacter primus]QEK38336.1 hypothetical protein FZC34_00130 [Candidatus Cytomitobacter primus]